MASAFLFIAHARKCLTHSKAHSSFDSDIKRASMVLIENAFNSALNTAWGSALDMAFGNGLISGDAVIFAEQTHIQRATTRSDENYDEVTRQPTTRHLIGRSGPSGDHADGAFATGLRVRGVSSCSRSRGG